MPHQQFDMSLPIKPRYFANTTEIAHQNLLTQLFRNRNITEVMYHSAREAEGNGEVENPSKSRILGSIIFRSRSNDRPLELQFQQISILINYCHVLNQWAGRF